VPVAGTFVRFEDAIAASGSLLQDAGGQIIVGESPFWDDLNPLTLSDAKGLDLFITEPLIIYDREDWSLMLPGLAESWEVSEDSLTYTFQLRSTTFSDGTPFTSADVLFTLQTAMDPATPYVGPVPVSLVSSVEAPSDSEITVTLAEPSAVFLKTLSRFGIVPKHLLEGEDLATTEFRRFPVGTGPFVVAEHDAEFFTLEANSTYWGDPPGVSRIAFSSAPDAAARSAKLRAGDIDLTRLEPMTQAGLDGSGFHIDTAQSLGWLSCEVNHAHSLLGDANVRKALLHAVDREGLLGAINPGMSSVASGPLVPSDAFFESNVATYPYDLDAAAALMETAGWTRDGDGAWQKDGERASVTLMAYQPNPVIFNTNLALEESWRTFGIDVTVDVAPDWSSWWDRYIAGDFDAGVMDWAYGFDPNGMSGNFTTGGSMNGSGYSNAEIDDLFFAGSTMLDADARKDIYSQIQIKLADDLATLWIAWQDRGIIMRDGVNATYNPVGDFYANAYWWTLSD
jgi:peptide/nickel transport system substrate-binding protein